MKQAETAANFGLMRVQNFVALPAPQPAAVLLDRLWPRGISKARLAQVLWAKDVTPSTALRQWLHADPAAHYTEFCQRYRAELAQAPLQAALNQLRQLHAQYGGLILLSAAKDLQHSHLPVLAAVLANTDS